MTSDPFNIGYYNSQARKDITIYFGMSEAEYAWAITPVTASVIRSIFEASLMKHEHTKEQLDNLKWVNMIILTPIAWMIGV